MYRNTVPIIREALTILDGAPPTHRDPWNLVVTFLRSSILFLKCLLPDDGRIMHRGIAGFCNETGIRIFKDENSYPMWLILTSCIPFPLSVNHSVLMVASGYVSWRTAWYYQCPNVFSPERQPIMSEKSYFLCIYHISSRHVLVCIGLIKGGR